MGESAGLATGAAAGERVPLVRSLTLALLLSMLGFVKYGLGPNPAFSRYVDFAQTWQEMAVLPESAGYSGFSPATFVLLGTLGLTSPSGYWIGSVLLHVVAVGLPLLMPLARRDPVTQGLVFTFLAGGAVLPSLTFWIGGYDSIIVIAASVAALARNRWVRTGAWALFAFQHSQLALIALAFWAVLMLIHQRENRSGPVARDIVLGVGGVVVGSVAIRWLAASLGLMESRVDFLEETGIATMAQLFWPQAWLVVFGVLGVGWFVLLDHRVRGAAMTRAVLIGGLALGLVLPHLVLDAVRVPALAMIVPVLSWVRFAPDQFDECTLQGLRRTYLPIAVVLPVVLVWEGRAYFPGWTVLLDGTLRLAF